ncbi:MAG: hypothetical protein BWY40_00577 [bacterium ADurb.Bin270]|jgi:hypothetical protein|nr:hypothetical protein [Myxococcales bacterium]OQA61564.1 MAG: hypothetical protein BWY40_00577 [bacterium ADurb.Bin270]
MKKLKDALEQMQARKVKCTLNTLNTVVGKEYQWDEVSTCGATETAQAHLTMSDGATTRRWSAPKYQAVRDIVSHAQLVRSASELKKLLGMG